MAEEMHKQTSTKTAFEKVFFAHTHFLSNTHTVTHAQTHTHTHTIIFIRSFSQTHAHTHSHTDKKRMSL